MDSHRHLLSPTEGGSTAVDDDSGHGGRSNPGLTISTAEPPSVYARHGHSSSFTPEESSRFQEREAPRDYFPQTPLVDETNARTSAGPSVVSSIMRRMTTIRSPITRTKFRTIRRSQGGQYATLGEGNDGEPGPVDLSTLGGLESLGYELRDLADTRSAPFEHEQTEYVSPQTRSDKPNFKDFVAKRKSLGDGIGQGMKDTAELVRNPTKAVRREQSVPSRDAAARAIDRKKTVRDVGKQLANERKQIVAVSDVDLSSFEGFQPVRSSKTFDGNGMNRASTLPEETQSYFFPEDPDIPNWKPFSMSMYYIISLTLLALLLGAVEEILCQKSLRRQEANSGLVEFDYVANVTTIAFFSWKYLPTMVTIIFAVLFSIMDFDIRRLEPYYQLSQPSGAQAAASLNLDHLTAFQYFVPFSAFHLRQWAVFLSTTGNIFASVVAPALQNPALIFVENDAPGCSDNPDNCPPGQTRYWVRIEPGWSRALSASYWLIAIITMILTYQLRRKSGLLSDPKGIAGIASMATKSHILRDFKGMDQANLGDIHRRLRHRRFVLYKSSIWQGEWTTQEEETHESERRLVSPHPVMLRKATMPFFLGFMLFCLGGVLVISLTRARKVPNVAPWLPILVATVLKLVFTTFEADVRLMEPFYQLSQGNALPENSLTLDYQATVYGWMPIKASLNGHWLVALVGLASVSLDILTVTVGSFSVDSHEFLHKPSGKENYSNQDETFTSFWVSLILSVVILLFVMTTTALVYWRRHHPFLPREPSTIASVLAFIYASNMLTDFIDTERLTNAQMEARLKGINKRYGLGWVKGRDGDIHIAIDEEPMKSKYVHGKPYTMSQAGPLQPADTFYTV
jgi:hypothetical protein